LKQIVPNVFVVSADIYPVEWARQNGAHVINMSLGGPGPPLETAETYFREIREEGTLVISAAGNNGSTDYAYPASYSSVVSVGAVDDLMKRAQFSQLNSEVDIAGPGVHILSTVPIGFDDEKIASIDVSGVAFVGSIITGTRFPVGSGITGPLVFCPSRGTVPCPSVSGGICLIERCVWLLVLIRFARAILLLDILTAFRILLAAGKSPSSKRPSCASMQVELLRSFLTMTEGY